LVWTVWGHADIVPRARGQAVMRIKPATKKPLDGGFLVDRY